MFVLATKMIRPVTVGSAGAVVAIIIGEGRA